MNIYALDGITPVVHPSAFVHQSAVLVGDVIVGPNCYVGPNASLRGDFGRVILEKGSNVQDTCVMHAFPGMDTLVESNGHIGHGAVLHGCLIRRNVMVGMNAVVMDGAEIGESSIVGALAFVKANEKIPPRSMVMGIPAKVIRSLTDEEIAWKAKGTAIYQQLVDRSARTMKQVDPLQEIEPDRKRIGDLDFAPLYQMRHK
jgi:phenylacetic acid degradation protein